MRSIACFDLDNTLIDRDGAFAAWAKWWVAVVTNGGTVQLGLKLAHTGIGSAVDFTCISEAVGVRKPDPAIFKHAAERCAATLDGGWMVGDHPAYDTAGGIAAGLRTIQVGNRPPESWVATHRCDSVVAAFPVILG
ncbi:HAD family hydrolase [Kribbella sp. NPDC006257]|uniref:HAD family hydrolase n=1 Tax=Kribbella sp. NPDC006257 TaxID=3156738 RepID=UPI0033A06FD2